MTTTYSNVVEQIGNDWVGALNRTADVAAKLADDTQRANAKFVKELPARLSLAPQVAKLGAALPASVPRPTEVVEANFELVQRVATAHRDLAIRLIEVSSGNDVASPKTVSSRKDG
jgi:hypothetical protein